MKFSLIPFSILAVSTTTNAFVPSLQRHKMFASTPRYADPAFDEPMVDTTPMEPGSHDELMYALGVNLARQLGDVRPLVESGEELASVAKGLLDTVIGRLSEDGQRNLLAQRGADLNALITGRA
jgi:hypothetical protein